MPSTRRSRALTIVPLAAILVMSVAGPVGAQGNETPFARWIHVSGTCEVVPSTWLGLEGSMQVALPAEARVVFEYRVDTDTQFVDLGDADVDATATTSQTLPYTDSIFFGSRFVPEYPYTYTQDASTRVDGDEVYGIELQARCDGPGPATITVTERGGPVPPPPPEPAPDSAPPEPVAATPRFTG